MSQDHNERYIAIARACLRAINDAATESSDRAEQIHRVYEAIDEAFQAQLSEDRQQIRDLERILERIAHGGLSANQMMELARAALASDQPPEQDDSLH